MSLLRWLQTGVLALAAACVGIPRSGHAQEVFGQRETSEAALIGTFYDFKQTQAHKPTGVSPSTYSTIVEEFLNQHWDESVLNRYFRSGRALYTTQIFIPMMSAGAAPKAFELQDVVKPSCWVTHYKGQVSAPADGRYRFIGYADDLIAVAVNEKTVLYGIKGDKQATAWQSPEPKAAGYAANGPLIYGDWVDLKKGQIIDLDVLIGERPGGQFCAFLLYEKEGAQYPLSSGRRSQPMFPVFQLSPYTLPDYGPSLAPPISQGIEPWKGYQ